MCPHWDFSQGEEARTGSLLTCLSSPSIPIHSFFPHSSSSFLVLLLYIKSQDQVTRSGSSYINRTTRSLEKLFYFSRKSGFIVSTKKKKKRTKPYFGFQKPNSESFSLHSCHKKFQYTTPTLTPTPASSAGPKQEGSAKHVQKILPLVHVQNAMQF